MNPESEPTPHQLWLDKIHAALVRARERAKKIARQTGTPLVYMQDGKIIHEYVDSEKKTD